MAGSARSSRRRLRQCAPDPSLESWRKCMNASTCASFRSSSPRRSPTGGRSRDRVGPHDRWLARALLYVELTQVGTVRLMATCSPADPRTPIRCSRIRYFPPCRVRTGQSRCGSLQVLARLRGHRRPYRLGRPWLCPIVRRDARSAGVRIAPIPPRWSPRQPRGELLALRVTGSGSRRSASPRTRRLRDAHAQQRAATPD